MAKSTYKIVGRIGGKMLPTETVQIGPFAVGPIPSNQIPLERPRNASAKPDAPSFYEASTGDVFVKSDCYFSVACDAESPRDATDYVRENEVLLLQLALSIATDGTQYRTEVLWAQDGSEWRNAFGSVSKFEFWYPTPIPPEQVRAIQKLYEAMDADSTAKLAALLLGRAIRQMDTANDPAEREAALMTFFKVIECIALTAQQEITEDIKRRQEHAIRTLAECLDSEKSLNKKVAEVFKAQSLLARAEMRFISLKIEAKGVEIGLPLEWRTLAVDFAKFRSRRLGHPASPIGGKEFAHWWGRDKLALKLAREMLVFYLKKASSDQATPDCG